MSKIDVKLRVAKVSENPAILEFLREYFYKEEPLTNAHIDPGHTWDDEEFSLSHTKNNTTVIACHPETDEIVGVLFAGAVDAEDADAFIESSKNSTKKWGEIQRLMAYLEKKADVLKKYNVDKSLQCHGMAVHKDYRGMGIGEKLFLYTFENARKLGFEILSIDCTSIYNVKTALKVGMEEVSHATYDEYNELIGQELFIAIKPHTYVKTFVKVL